MSQEPGHHQEQLIANIDCAFVESEPVFVRQKLGRIETPLAPLTVWNSKE